MPSARNFISVLVTAAALTACAVPTIPVASSTALASPTVEVTRVIDGDTFVVAGGEKVRVLGIDSCEAGTAGGTAATAQARQLLEGHQVVLSAEPGHDRDRYGRQLRYVQLMDGRDFGTRMVSARHTYPYQGRNDASARYMATLQAQDINGRTC